MSASTISAMTARPDHQDRLARLTQGAAMRGLTPVLTIAQSVWPLPRTAWHAATRSGTLLIGNLEAADAESAAEALAAAQSQDMECWLDGSSKGPQSQTFRELLSPGGAIGWYSDLAVWADAILALLVHHLTPGPLAEVVLAGASPLTDALAHRTVQAGYDVTRSVAIVGAEPGAMALVGTSFHTPVISVEALQKIAADGVVPLCIDGGIGSFDAAALAYAAREGWPVWRPDMRAALGAAIAQARQYRTMLTRHAGAREIAGVRIVAGGLVGAAGDLVVDRLEGPVEILGWADGQGGLLTSVEDAAWLERRRRVEASLRVEG